MPDTVVRGGRGNTITFDSSSFIREYSNSWAISSQPEYKYIHQYNYNPDRFIFQKLDNENELYLGIELEIDSGGKNDDNAKMVIDFLGEQNVYCKHDGSIENGFEIVTHPCTYEYHKQLPYEDLFDRLSKLGYRSHDVNTCGLHVHFNRNYFAKDKLTQDLSISKLLYIFEKYWDKIVTIARRNSNNYAKRFYLKDDETILDMYAKSKNSNKYGVVNLQHKDTVEIRIFKGTLNYRSFMATLQFVQHIVNIIKSVDIYNIQSLTWEDIASYFDDDLKSYIKEREEIQKTEKKEIPLTSTINLETYSYESLTRAWRDMSVCSLDIVQTPQTISEEDQLRRRMDDLEQQIRRSRNPLEQRNLRREHGQLTNRLGELRRGQ